MIIDLLERDLKLLANGYEPIVEHKGVPVYEGWPSSEVRPESLKIYRQVSSPADGCLVQGTAIRTTHTPCVDIDIVDPELALQVKALVEARLGADPNYPYRVGSKGFALLYRTEQPFQSVKVMGGARGNVEIHCANSKGGGAKISWFGPHPKGGTLVYTQHGTPLERFPHDGLFEINHEQVVALAQELMPLLGEGADISGLPYEGPARDWTGLADPERAAAYAAWEIAAGRGAWAHKPTSGNAHDILHHRAVRLHRLGVDLHDAMPLLEEWMGDYQSDIETAERHLNDAYGDEYLFGSELPPGQPQKVAASERFKDHIPPRDPDAPAPEPLDLESPAPRPRRPFQTKEVSEPGAKPLNMVMELDEAEARLEDPEMLVSGLIPNKVVTIAYGDTNAGKTYFTLEVLAAVAAGRRVFNKFDLERSADGVVVFFAGEDAASLVKSRVKAIQNKHGPLQGKLMVVACALPVFDETTCFAIEKELDKIVASGRKILAIANDTLKRSIGMGDSNDSATAHLFTTMMEDMARRYQCAVIVNAHHPKTGGGIGGSKDFENGVSWSYELKGEGYPDNPKRLKGIEVVGVKARTGQQPDPFYVEGIPTPLTPPVGGNKTDLVMVVGTSKKRTTGKLSKAADLRQTIEGVLRRHGEPCNTDTLKGLIARDPSIDQDTKADATGGALAFYDSGKGKGEWVKTNDTGRTNGVRGALHGMWIRPEKPDEAGLFHPIWLVPNPPANTGEKPGEPVA